MQFTVLALVLLCVAHVSLAFLHSPMRYQRKVIITTIILTITITTITITIVVIIIAIIIIIIIIINIRLS